MVLFPYPNITVLKTSCQSNAKIPVSLLCCEIVYLGSSLLFGFVFRMLAELNNDARLLLKLVLARICL